MADPQKKEQGRRLRDTAQAAGFTSDAIGERLSYSGGGVRGWWIGKTEPPSEVLKQYAELVGVSVHYLMHGAEDPLGPTASPREWALRFADLVYNRMDAAEAIDRAAPPENEKERLTEEERTLLTAAGEGIRATLEERSGGNWNALTDDQKREILHQVERLALENRRGQGSGRRRAGPRSGDPE